MTYYDDDFRKILLDILKTYRETLVQESLKPQNEESRPLITNQIKQVDEALKLVKPSIFDKLTPKKIEKLQKELFSKEKEEEIRQKAKADLENEVRTAFTQEMEDKLRKELKPKVRKEVRETFTKEVEDKLRAELTPKIIAEIEKGLTDKQSEDGVKKLANQFVHFVSKAFPEQVKAISSPSPQTANSETPENDYEDLNKEESPMPKKAKPNLYKSD